MSEENKPTCATCGKSGKIDPDGACSRCDYLHLCAHRNVEGQCRTCATAAETARKAAAYDGLRAALTKIDEIRNSIVGTQTVNWSAHVYPMVAALEEAGFRGQGSVEAREQALTLIEQRDALAAKVAELEAARAELRAMSRQALDEKNALIKRRQTQIVELDRRRLAQIVELEAELDSATARAEALASALRALLPSDHYGADPCDAQCSDACVFDGDECEGQNHRPDIGDDECNAHPRIDERERICARCIAIAALEGTPPADLTQHPAYRAGRRAGLEEAASVCDESRRSHNSTVNPWRPEEDEKHNHRADEAEQLAEDIRAHLEAK